MKEEIINVQIRLRADNNDLVQEMILSLVMAEALDQEYAREIYLSGNVLRINTKGI